MPVIRQTGRGVPLASLRGHLADLLVKELLGDRTRNAPVIFEIPVGPSEMDVVVVWEAWRDLPPLERISAIRDAYSRYRDTLERKIRWNDPAGRADPSVIPAVQMATGVTWEESSDFLPFRIEPNVRPGEIEPDELQTLMAEAGGIVTPHGVQLRFPNAQMAADAHAVLEAKMPEAHWSIVEEFGPVVEGW